MAHSKPKRGAPTIDMTAMVDVAFLLLTFFILTTKFKAEEIVSVDTPTSISETVVPLNDILTITVAEDGRIFFGVGDQVTREGMLDRMRSSYNFPVSETGKMFFLNTPAFGVPIQEMGTWLGGGDINVMKEYAHKGIPVDKRRGRLNELKEWINAARRTNTRLRFAVKGDQDALYKNMDKVIYTLQDVNINKFNLVTGLEADPNAASAEAAGSSD